MHVNGTTITLQCAQISGLSKLNLQPWLCNKSKQIPLSHQPTHSCSHGEPSCEWVLQDISEFRLHKQPKNPYSAANDKSSSVKLCIMITSSLSPAFLSERRCFVLWLAFSLVYVVTLLVVTGQWSASWRQGWEVEAVPETRVGRAECCWHYFLCWGSLVKFRRSHIM